MERHVAVPTVGRDAAGFERLVVEIAGSVQRREVSADAVLVDVFNINRALKFVEAVWQAGGIELDVNSFYLWPTLRDLARAMADGSFRNVPKLIRIRKGTSPDTLIVFAGGASCFLEMKDFVNALAFDGTVYGMALTPFGRPAASPAVIADEVAACLAELEVSDIVPPYRFVGYSFGGLVALELSRVLAARGARIDFLALVDSPQSEHAWPLRTWLAFAAGRLLSRGGGIPAAGAEEASGEPSKVLRGGRLAKYRRTLRRLAFRFLSPKAEIYPTFVPQWLGGYPPAYDRAARQLLRMKGLYRPSRYEGPLVFYRTEGGSPVDCDPKLIWEAYLPAAEWVDVSGNHQTIMVGRHARALAADVSRRLAAAATA
ncbi:thioesterase domain-containing protein [Ciceribacter sp. RN22]|uniref:thioesterase domain-containing protein n=1 Tax=Ciceribacter sp. RN22 TaxID=2954932 RepID=UPI002092A98D|nr:thioesterase domain-containing protein [Ciceribacter sp. RN22]MCO6178353.1 thioesterase domain-containing protein [Ciceribacter sp. RN22]